MANNMKTDVVKPVAASVVIIVCMAFFCAYSIAGESRELVIFHAGSLSVPFREMAKAFEDRHPGIKVVREAAGSRTCARKIIDLGRKCDIMASADYTVIEDLLIPEYASWNISFATNEMAIMYRPDSKCSKKINAGNWYSILLKKGVEYGHSDPNADPCGYRTMLVWQLAEKYYKVPGLYEKLKAGCPLRNVRPKETDLIALLEAGELDYLFIYRSVCLQHKALFVELPARINLGSFRYAGFYRQAGIKIAGKTPGDFVEKTGRPMVYGITIPKNAPHLQTAIRFVSFLLGPEGRAIMEKNGQAPVYPVKVTGDIEKLPAGIKAFLQ